VASETQLHRASLAVWDVPSTVVAGERFTIKAGAKSSAEQSLHGRRIEARDAVSTVVASGELGSTPWPDTRALYWTELSLQAPAQHGVAWLSLHLATDGITHGAAAARFCVAVVPPPEHAVTIRVVEQETAAPIEAMDVRLGVHRATTSASGQAEVRLAKGRYNLRIWKVGYDAAPRPIDVDGDISVEVAAVIVPEENADRAWRG
jgi:hypothetical protein